MAVKCVICHISFKKRDALKKHFVEDHSVPENDKVLDRYLKLRFSTSTIGKNWDRKRSMLVRLAKLLKARLIRHTLNREKVKLRPHTVEKLLYDYVTFDDDDVESVASGAPDVKNYSKMAAVVNWFLKYYNVFVNRTIDNDNQIDLVKLFSAEDRDFSKCSRLKIEQKHNVKLDFRVNVPEVREGISPSENFNEMQKVLYGDFLKSVANTDTTSQFQLLIEMSVEFVKSDSNEYMGENKDDWEREGNFFSGDGISECVEERSIKEYSSFDKGSTAYPIGAYQKVMGAVMQKVANSYNVVGSDWALRTE